jgi:hypothetical protein
VNEDRLRLLSLGANLRGGDLTPLRSLSCLFDLLCFLYRVGGWFCSVNSVSVRHAELGRFVSSGVGC